ncbi:hypothetical protein [Anabaena sp. 90]|nr:hypothetical protein [Anabaena sp. 90]
MKIVFDTNIVLDILLEREPKDFKTASLPIYSPTELLSIIQEIKHY